MTLFTSFCPLCGPNAFLLIRDKRIEEDKIEGMMSQAKDHIRSQMAAKPPMQTSEQPPQVNTKPSTPINKTPSTGYSASKAPELPENDNFFKKLKKWFGKQ